MTSINKTEGYKKKKEKTVDGEGRRDVQGFNVRMLALQARKIDPGKTVRFLFKKMELCPLF